MKMAASEPAMILGAASAQTRLLRGRTLTLSGSTSPKTSTSRPEGSARMKKAVESTIVRPSGVVMGPPGVWAYSVGVAGWEEPENMELLRMDGIESTCCFDDALFCVCQDGSWIPG